MLLSRSLFFAMFLTAAFSGAAFAQWPASQGQQPQEGWASSPQPQQAPPAQSGQGWGTAPQSFDGDPASRMNRLEEQLRAMNGKVEQLEFQNKTLQDQLKRVQEDAEFRFQEIEGGKKGTGPRPQRTEAPSMSRSAATNNTAPPAAAAPAQTNARQLGAPPQALGQLPADQAGNPINLGPPAAVSQPLDPLPGSEDQREDAASRGPATAVSAPSGDPKDQFDLAYGYMLRGDYEMAEVSFKDFLEEHPEDTNAASAAYWLGESQYQRKQYKAAAESFLKVYNDHPSSAKAPESLLRLGMSLKSLGQKDAACATLSEVSRKYPKSSTAVKKRVQTEQKNAGC
ncbi:MAG: tol-pal system protein YbgF [Pseudomonadota bacterium]